MKTRSNRYREKHEGELMESPKKKFVFKGIQIAISVVLNTLLFYVLKVNFLADDVFLRILQVFIIAIISVMTSNMIAVVIVMTMFKASSVRQLVSRDNSIGKFFAIALIYSVVTAICFSFGVFTVLYSALGDGTMLTLMIAYALFYFVVEFFSYGLVTWAFGLSQTLKKQRGG